MGITGELVRSVFSKSRSATTHENNVRSSAAERRRWRAVRSYLCGDELNSVLAVEDSASMRSTQGTFVSQINFESFDTTITESTLESSEATVTQPILEDSTEKHVESKEGKEELKEGKENSTAKLFRQEDAATVIQTAFREFLGRRQNGGIKSENGAALEARSPGRESIGTSIEVQTGNSVGVLSTPQETMSAQSRSQQKSRTPVLRLKEDWDDSTVNSNISQMRIQNRLEATTRRERALAYAFSQQLRICSKKRQNRSEDTETNMGWNWLERWMATRLPETASFENNATNQLDPNGINQRSVVRKRLFDMAGELEKESCGSNEVSLQIDGFSAVSKAKDEDETKRTKIRIKVKRNISRRKTAPSHNCPREHIKVSKKDCSNEDETDKKHKPNEEGNKNEIKCQDAITPHDSPDRATSENSKVGY